MNIPIPINAFAVGLLLLPIFALGPLLLILAAVGRRRPRGMSRASLILSGIANSILGIRIFWRTDAHGFWDANNHDIQGATFCLLIGVCCIFAPLFFQRV